MIRTLAALAAALAPVYVRAHAIDERYDLPAPLSYFVAGAAATVALSVVVAIVFARGAPAGPPSSVVIPISRKLAWTLRWFCGVLGVLTLVLVVSAALWGTGNPMMNFAPTAVWILWWIGGSIVVACVGNAWPVIDPWRALFDGVDAIARRLFGIQGIALDCAWPQCFGAWPAVALLFVWAGLEVIYPLAAVPYRIGWAAIVWTLITLTGMVLFGRDTWQRNGDVFAIYFGTLGHFSPLAAASGGIALRAPGAGLIATELVPAAMVGFTIAMLSTVLFDGLLGVDTWRWFESMLKRHVPRLLDANGYAAGTAGLIVVWVAFLVAYVGTAVLTARLVGAGSGAIWARRYALTLVPIAVAYSVAHNFSSLAIQGQHAIALASDPFGFGWNLFGTAHLRPNIGIIDARLTWIVAIVAIVGGHVIAVWLAHRVALRECGSPRRAVVASIPLTVLMVAYTAISLSVIAEPMVRFDPPPAESAWLHAAPLLL